MPERVKLDIPLDVLRDVRHAARTALNKHIEKSYSGRGAKHRASHQVHAERLRAFLGAIDAQLGDIKFRSEDINGREDTV